MQNLIRIFSQFDANLIEILTLHHMLAYITFFLVIFLETGILFAALLPGDSLLIACGTLAAKWPDVLNIDVLFFLLVTAVVAGNMVNYFIGKWFGSKLYSSRMAGFLNKNYIEQAKAMFRQGGGKVIIIACFIPVVRTFAPFVAGLTGMPFAMFFICSWIGALSWIGTLLYGSYLIDSIPVIKQHLTVIISVIFIIVVLTSVINYLRRKYR